MQKEKHNLRVFPGGFQALVSAPSWVHRLSFILYPQATSRNDDHLYFIDEETEGHRGELTDLGHTASMDSSWLLRALPFPQDTRAPVQLHCVSIHAPPDSKRGRTTPFSAAAWDVGSPPDLPSSHTDSHC